MICIVETTSQREPNSNKASRLTELGAQKLFEDSAVSVDPLYEIPGKSVESVTDIVIIYLCHTLRVGIRRLLLPLQREFQLSVPCAESGERTSFASNTDRSLSASLDLRS